MKFAIVASLLAATQAIKVMSEEQIALMSFDEQNQLIADVKSESTALHGKIDRLYDQHTADTAAMNAAIQACDSRQGELNAELDSEQTESEDLRNRHIEEFDEHVRVEDQRYQGIADEYSTTIAGLEADLQVAQAAAAAAFQARLDAEQRFDLANDALEAEATRHRLEMEGINSQGAADIAFPNDENARLSAEQADLAGIESHNREVIIPDLEAQLAQAQQ